MIYFWKQIYPKMARITMEVGIYALEQHLTLSAPLFPDYTSQLIEEISQQLWETIIS